jgi:DnaJ-domain-containing protein 1
LSAGSTFIEFVSKDGQQRFVAHHQIASIEPLASISAPTLPSLQEGPDMEAFSVLGIKADDTLETAMTAFQSQLKLYNPEKWTGEGIPFEFSRYAAQKTRQINMAFTVVRGELQARAEARKAQAPKTPLFGANKLAG